MLLLLFHGALIVFTLSTVSYLEVPAFHEGLVSYLRASYLVGRCIQLLYVALCAKALRLALEVVVLLACRGKLVYSGNSHIPRNANTFAYAHVKISTSICQVCYLQATASSDDLFSFFFTNMSVPDTFNRHTSNTCGIRGIPERSNFLALGSDISAAPPLKI